MSQASGVGGARHLVRHTARRRTSIMLAGAVALSVSGCGLLDGVGGSKSSPTSSVPLPTTSTTEPTTSGTSTSASEDKPPLVGPRELIKRVKGHLKASSSVAIEGTIHDEDGDTMTIEAQGSTGGVVGTSARDGASTSTVTREHGGRLETRVIGYDGYLKADTAWFEGRETTKSPLAEYAGRWVKLPWGKSPIDVYRPSQLIRGSFFGEGLTPYDQNTGTVTIEKLAGEWIYRIDLGTAGTQGQQVDRVMWIAPEVDSPEVRRLTFAEGPRRSTLKFSEWNSAPEDVHAPAGAQTLEVDQVGKL